MLTKFDDFLCHQIVAPFDQVSQSHPNWTDKTYLSVFDTSGKIVAGAAFGKYPNRNVMDAFGTVSVDGKQYTVRASRELYPPSETDLIERVGPMSYEVVEPLKKVRYCLGENDYGISFDIEFEGHGSPLEEFSGRVRHKGVTINDGIRIYQLGRAKGKIKVEGKTYDVKKDTWCGYRDHSWGIRAVTGVPLVGSFFFRGDQGSPESGLMPIPTPSGYLCCYFCAQFKEFSLFYSHAEDGDGKPIHTGLSGISGYIVYAYGDPRPPLQITGAKFDWEFWPGTTRIKRVREVVMTLEDGTQKRFSTKPLGIDYFYYPGGYYGFRGWWNGKWHGPQLVVAGETLDLKDQKVLDELLILGNLAEEISFECTCDGETGYGCLQPGVVGELRKYDVKVPHRGT